MHVALAVLVLLFFVAGAALLVFESSRSTRTASHRQGLEHVLLLLDTCDRQLPPLGTIAVADRMPWAFAFVNQTYTPDVVRMLRQAGKRDASLRQLIDDWEESLLGLRQATYVTTDVFDKTLVELRQRTAILRMFIDVELRTLPHSAV